MAIYKDEKRKTWFVRMRIKMPDGTMKQVTKRGFLKKQEAKEWEYMKKIGFSETVSLASFEDVALHYLAEHKTRVVDSTYQESYRVIKTYIFPMFAKKECSYNYSQGNKDLANKNA